MGLLDLNDLKPIKQKHKDIDDPFINGLLYVKKKDSKFKQRPHLCLTAFTNNAGVVYNYLLVPITSVKTVGGGNLIKIQHRKLKKDSYCKLNNMFIVNTDEIRQDYDIISDKFEIIEIEKVKKGLNKLLVK